MSSRRSAKATRAARSLAGVDLHQPSGGDDREGEARQRVARADPRQSRILPVGDEAEAERESSENERGAIKRRGPQHGRIIYCPLQVQRRRDRVTMRWTIRAKLTALVLVVLLPLMAAAGVKFWLEVEQGRENAQSDILECASAVAQH